MHLTNFDLDNYLKELETIVNMDSGSSYPEGVAKVADFFIKKYKELGCYTDKVNLSPRIGPCVRVLTKHTDRFDVLLVGHMDTVFPEGTTLKRPFRIKDRIAYGPGVVDMKAGLLSAYYVIKEWMSQKNREGSICLLMNSDEEIGSVYSTPWIKEHAAKSKVSFVLEPARSDGSFVIERKGTAKFEVIFRGVSAHAGVDPEKGKSAIVEMARWILELDELNDYEKGLTLNTGTVTGGTVVNMVANHAVMKLDTRFKNPEQIEKVESVMNRMIENPMVKGVTASVKRISYREPMNPNERTCALAAKLERLGKKSGISVKWRPTGGVSDGNGISSLGIPVIDGFGPVGGNTHNEGEYLEIDSVYPRIRLLYDIITTV
jgi:glutamate carboxypeptidase